MPRPKKGEEHPRPGYGDRIGMLSAIGTPTDHIARIIGISNETLHKHYQNDLDLGASKAGAVVGGKIFEAAKRGEQWACTLWAARRLGWKETSIHHQTGADGGPIRVGVVEWRVVRPEPKS
jgi:hypothetical protein